MAEPGVAAASRSGAAPPEAGEPTEVLDAADTGALQRAVQRLAEGRLVAFPTETVYGLGARADDDAAVASIFSAKGRPAGHPLIVHVTDEAAARRWAAHWPAEAQRLAAAFWPGPLTLILPRAPGRGAVAAAGQASIGLRCPDHPAAQALLRAAAARGIDGVAAPSANRFGRVSPTCAAHVRDEFAHGLLVLDGGDCAAGIESAIVDLSGDLPLARRPGTLTRSRIEAVLGRPLGVPDAAVPRASGDPESHYAPSARVELWTGDALADALRREPAPPTLALYSRRPLPLGQAVHHRLMPDDPAAAAHELFAALRSLDAPGVQCIRVEAPVADDPAWDGVRDRLRRAAAPRG